MKIILKILIIISGTAFLVTKNMIFLLVGEVFCLMEALQWKTSREETIQRSFLNHLVYLGFIDVGAFIGNYTLLKQTNIFFALFAYVEITFLLISVNLILAIILTGKIYDLRSKKLELNPSTGSAEQY